MTAVQYMEQSGKEPVLITLQCLTAGDTPVGSTPDSMEIARLSPIVFRSYSQQEVFCVRWIRLVQRQEAWTFSLSSFITPITYAFWGDTWRMYRTFEGSRMATSVKYLSPALLLSAMILLAACSTPAVSIDPETGERKPFFSRGNECAALVAWTAPLEREFPDRLRRYASDKEAGRRLKFLFVDDAFVPTFGKRFDALSTRRLTAIGREVARIRNCEEFRESPISNTLSHLHRAFNRKNQYGDFNYGLVEEFMQSRRTALSRVQVSAGHKPTAQQLLSLSQLGGPVFHLLWPSERQIVESQASDVAVDDAAGSSDAGVAGIWHGEVRCGRNYQDVTFDIQDLPGRIAGTMTTGYRPRDFYLRPQLPNQYLIDSDLNVFGENLQLLEMQGLLPLISVPVGGGCSRAVAARFDPLAGIGGKYSQADSFDSFCKSVVGSWLYTPEERENTSKRLKEDLYPLLNRYNSSLAARNALFSPSVLEEAFGEQISRMGGGKRQSLARQIATCAVLSERVYGHSSVRSLFDPRSINTSRQKLFGGNETEAISPAPVSGYRELLDGKAPGAAATGLADAFRDWRRIAEGEGGLARLEQLIRDQAPGLDRYDTLDVEQTLRPMAATLQHLRIADRARKNAAKRDLYATMLEGVSIPYASILSPYGDQLRRLANGDPVNIDGSSLLFFGGLSGHYLENCPGSASGEARLRIASFASTGVLRAGIGSNYSNPDIGQMMADAASSQSVFLGGQSAARLIGCDGAGPLLTYVDDLIQSNSQSRDGEASLFVRSCAAEFDERRCSCLANVGRAAFPNIHKRRYNRSIIPSIISANPLVGLQIGMTCGIVNY